MSQPQGPERSAYADPATGAKVTQWTSGPHTNQHLYFTSPSVTADDRWLVFISNRSGDPNLHAIRRRDGSIRQLSHNKNGLLRSYVYPQGGWRGLSKASPCLDPLRNRLYYIRDDLLCVVDLDNTSLGEREIGRMPTRWYGAFTHVSPDGRTVCAPCTDSLAFIDPVETQWDQLRKVPKRIERERLTSRILLIDTTTGSTKLAAAVPFWVTHVQFDPKGSGRILFNQEGFGEDGKHPPQNRIWCLEPDGSYRPLSPEPTGEWRAHENWAVDGKSVLYHGADGDGPFLAARTWEGALVQKTYLAGIHFWHATGTVDGRRLLVDRPDGFISLVDPSAQESRIVDICRHDSSLDNQDNHPHPITTPRGSSLVFTSSRTGTAQIYEVSIPAVAQ